MQFEKVGVYKRLLPQAEVGPFNPIGILNLYINFIKNKTFFKLGGKDKIYET